ncbi:hypothetical protein D3C75_679090 [compost metagenome]
MLARLVLEHIQNHFAIRRKYSVLIQQTGQVLRAKLILMGHIIDHSHLGMVKAELLDMDAVDRFTRKPQDNITVSDGRFPGFPHAGLLDRRHFSQSLLQLIVNHMGIELKNIIKGQGNILFADRPAAPFLRFTVPELLTQRQHGKFADLITQQQRQMLGCKKISRRQRRQQFVFVHIIIGFRHKDPAGLQQSHRL